MKVKKFLKLLLFTSVLALPLSIANADTCNDRINWRTNLSPPGYTHTQCPNGLGFPAFNAYRDASALVREGSVYLQAPEYEFAWARPINADDTIPGYSNQLGLRERIRLNTGQEGEIMVYMHNAGNPNLNSTGETIARNVRVKVNNFDQEGGDYLSSAGSVHRFDISIESSNSIPRVLTDTITIETEANKRVRLVPVYGYIDGCESVSDRHTCVGFSSSRFAPNDLIDTNGGLLVTSHFGGSGATNGSFFASEGYRKLLWFSVNVVDAPPPPPVCNRLKFSNKPTLAQLPETGEPVEICVNADPASLRDEYYVDLTGGGRRVFDADRRCITVTDWTAATKLELGLPITSDIEGAGSAACKDTYQFKEPPNVPICELLQFRVGETSINSEGQNVTVFTIGDGDLLPEIPLFRNNIDARVTRGRNVDIAVSPNNRRVTVTNWKPGNRIEIFVSNTDVEDCSKPYEFPDTPPTTDRCIELEMREGPTTTNSRGQKVTVFTVFKINPNNTDYSDKIRAEITNGRGRVNISDDKTTVTVTNWEDGTELEVFVKGWRDVCFDDHTFTDTPPPPPADRCIGLTLTPDETDLANFGETNRLKVFTEVEHENIDNPRVICEIAGEGDITKQNKKRIIFKNLTSETQINCYVEGYQDVPACNANLDLPTPPETPLCRDLNMKPNKYDYLSNGGQPTFEINSVSPTTFEGPFVWQILDEDGDEIYRDRNRNFTFTPPANRALDGTQTVKVSVPDRFEEEAGLCEDQATSKTPKVQNICPAFQIARVTKGGKLNTRTPFIPEDGSPIRLALKGYGAYEGNVIWRSSDNDIIFDDGDNQSRNRLITDITSEVVVRGGSPGSSLEVVLQNPEDDITDEDGVCADELISDDEPGDRRAEITKTVNHKYVGNGEEVVYTVRYKPLGFFDEDFDQVTLYDSIATHGVDGINAHSGPLGQLEPGRTLEVRTIGANIPHTGDILDPEGITFTGVSRIANADGYIEIVYTAIVRSGLDEEACKQLEGDCGERFINRAYDDTVPPERQFQVYPPRPGQLLPNEAEVIATCPFILSRGFGDVFLEDDIRGGIDVLQCSRKTSVEGPIFTPAEPEAPNIISVGSEDAGFASHRICQESSRGSSIPAYNNVTNLSSSVCEVALKLTEDSIFLSAQESLRSNIARIARGNTNLNSTSTLNTLSETQLDSRYGALNPNQNNKVYRKTNGDLTLSGDLLVDGQAKTIIVENGDLYINSNIDYATTASGKSPIIAFVVIGGDIIVDPSVENLVGVYAAVEVNSKGGRMLRSSTTNKTITIKGSVFLDIEPLFTGTTASGNLSRDRGAVTVRYDGRIVDNTPPGLESVIEFSQFQTATGSSIYSE